MAAASEGLFPLLAATILKKLIAENALYVATVVNDSGRLETSATNASVKKAQVWRRIAPPETPTANE